MVPTVTQQLLSLHRRLADTILPALPPDEEFAREQGRLMLATLNWLLDTHEYEYRYEVVENTDYRHLLSSLVNLGRSEVDEHLRAEIRTILAEAGLAEDEARTPLAELADQTRQLKQLAARLASVLLSGSDAEATQSLLGHAARVQEKRELAFYRMTGFSQEARELRSVLGRVRSDTSA